MSKHLANGCFRAVENYMNDIYAQGCVEVAERIAKAIRRRDWEEATLDVLYCALNYCRENYPNEPLFNHELYDCFHIEMALYFIKESKDFSEVISNIYTELRDWTGPIDLKLLRKENPRRSARLAGKRVAVK